MFNWLRKRRRQGGRPAGRESNPWPLDMPLLALPQGDYLSLADCCRGVCILGDTGSGKTSGPGQTVAKAFLRSGIGGLALTAKPDERALWERYARETGRSESLVILGPDRPYRFNFMDYEMRRPGAGGGHTENVVTLFSTVTELMERKEGAGQARDPYWQRAAAQLVRNATDVLMAAGEPVSLPNLHELVMSAPQSLEEVAILREKPVGYCGQCLHRGLAAQKTGRLAHDFEVSAKYWLSEFPQIPDKTRHSAVSTFSVVCDSFMRGVLRELFTTGINLVPEMCQQGVVIILDLSVKEYNEIGQAAQVLFKYIWCRAMERRNLADSTRPVFLWADEAQNFVTGYDMQFQATARSSRCCTVYLAQNLRQYHAALGGEGKAQAETDSLLGNFATKIFCANGCQVTNEWASNMIGQERRMFRSGSSSYGAELDGFGLGPGHSQTSASINEQLEHLVNPRTFTRLLKGGQGLVEAIMFQSGRAWKATDDTWMSVMFKQG